MENFDECQEYVFESIFITNLMGQAVVWAEHLRMLAIATLVVLILSLKDNTNTTYTPFCIADLLAIDIRPGYNSDKQK